MAEVRIDLIGEDRLSNVVSPAADKTVSAMDRIKTTWIELYAKWNLAKEALGTAMDYMEKGAKALSAEQSFHSVAMAYGVDADSMLAKMKQVSAGLIDESDLMQRSVRGLQQGLSENQLVQMLDVARSSARVAGVDVATAFDMIATASANQQTRGLKALGIVIDQTKAFEDYAKKLDIGVNALTELQQSQAIANAAIEEGQRQMKAMGDIQDTEYEKIQRQAATIKEFQEGLGKFFLGLKNVGIMMAYEVGSAINEIVVKLLTPFALLEGLMAKAGLAGDMFRNAVANAQAASDQWHGKAKDMWEGITADTDKANAALDAHKEKLKGVAAEQTRLENERMNAERSAKAEQKWRAELDASDISINETAKAISALNAKREEMVKDLGVSKAQGLYNEMLSNIYKKQQQEFDDMMLDRYSGMQKDLLEQDKWQRETLLKYSQVAGAAEQITDLDRRKRLDIVARYAKEELEKEKASLDQLKTYYQGVYDYAISKVQEYSNASDAAAKTSADITAFLNQYNAKSKSPQEQMEADKRAVMDQMKDAGQSWSQAAIDGAAKAGMDFLTKYKGYVDNIGFGQDFKGVQDALKELRWQSDQIKSNADEGKEYWSAYATNAAQNLDIVNQWMNVISEKVAHIDWYLEQEHQLKINTDQAYQALTPILMQLDSIQKYMNSLGGAQKGSGTIQFTAGSDTPGGGAPIEIPGAADGGYFTKPTIIAIAEKEPEYAIPAGKMQAMGSRTSITIDLGGITIQGVTDPETLAQRIVKPVRDEMIRLRYLSGDRS